MKFQKGNKLGKGRPRKVITQVKDWVKNHPYAVDALMAVLYEQGIKGDRESAMYVIDRIKGKPKAVTEIEGGEKIGAGIVLELFKMYSERDKLRLGEHNNDSAPQQAQIEANINIIEGGDFAIQRQGETEGSSQESSTEA